MANFHLVCNIVIFHNKQVKVNSLDEHPTESGHKKILDKSCYCDTCSLENRIRSATYATLKGTLLVGRRCFSHELLPDWRIILKGMTYPFYTLDSCVLITMRKKIVSGNLATKNIQNYG